MGTKKRERRRAHRVLIDKEKSIKGVFLIPGGSTKSFTANILNFSKGGMQVAVRKSISRNIKKDDILTLIKIEGKDTLLFNVEIDMKIKWVVAHGLLEQTGYGCEFIKLSEHDKSQITEFLNIW